LGSRSCSWWRCGIPLWGEELPAGRGDPVGAQHRVVKYRVDLVRLGRAHLGEQVIAGGECAELMLLRGGDVNRRDEARPGQFREGTGVEPGGGAGAKTLGMGDQHQPGPEPANR